MRLLCSTTEFRSYEGNQPPLHGKGGTRDIVNGIDIWRDGSPPRGFKIIGVIDDNRGGQIIPMARMDGDITAKAKASGGDAIMLLDAANTVTGSISSFNANTAVNPFNPYLANTTGTSSTVTIRHHSAKYAVLKYI